MVPDSREGGSSLLDSAACARRTREAAAERVARRLDEIKPHERHWRLREELGLG